MLKPSKHTSIRSAALPDVSRVAAGVSDCITSGLFTAQQLAAHLGVSPAAVSQWRSGSTSPSPQHLDALLDVLGQQEHEVARAAYMSILQSNDQADRELMRRSNEAHLTRLMKGLCDRDPRAVRLIMSEMANWVDAAYSTEDAVDRAVELIRSDPYISPSRSDAYRTALAVCAVSAPEELSAQMRQVAPGWRFVHLAARLLSAAPDYASRRAVISVAMSNMFTCSRASCNDPKFDHHGHLPSVAGFVFLCRAAALTGSDDLIVDEFRARVSERPSLDCFAHAGLVLEAVTRVSLDLACIHIGSRLLASLAEELGLTLHEESLHYGQIDEREQLELLTEACKRLRYHDEARVLERASAFLWPEDESPPSALAIAEFLTDEIGKKLHDADNRRSVFLAMGARTLIRQIGIRTLCDDPATNDDVGAVGVHIRRMFEVASETSDGNLNGLSTALMCLEGVATCDFLDLDEFAAAILHVYPGEAHIALAAFVWSSVPLRTLARLDDIRRVRVPQEIVDDLLQVWILGMDLYSPHDGFDTVLPITPPWISHVSAEASTAGSRAHRDAHDMHVVDGSESTGTKQGHRPCFPTRR